MENSLAARHGGKPGRGWNLGDRMLHYGVPGVSIAVLDDFELAWARGYGLLDAAGDRPVIPGTRFQTGSTGKLITTATALALVDEGLLDLDQDVNRRLRSWQVPESEFLRQGPVTLRHLLSHGAGLPTHGYRGYEPGSPLPTLLQIFEGEAPANSPPVRLEAEPGTRWRYANSGFMITQQLLMDVTGRIFPDLVQERIFDRLEMNASTYDTPAPGATDFALGHRSTGEPLPAGWHEYPELGAGGNLWTTPSDMAAFLREIMRAHQGRSGTVLSAGMTRQMLSRQIQQAGLGFAVHGDGDDLYCLHDGATEGFRAFCVIYPEQGQGAVIMTNGENGDQLYREILKGLTAEYDWPGIRNLRLEWILPGLALAALLLL